MALNSQGGKVPQNTKESHAQSQSCTGQGRICRPEEGAEMVVWLASERASFATGGFYSIDGGYLAH
jgi:NAD(P)-dependent dehydrogenase (short-subunit alcohol dehydrogenase family)